MHFLAEIDSSRAPQLSREELADVCAVMILGHTDWLQRHGDAAMRGKKHPDHQIALYWRKLSFLKWAQQQLQEAAR